MFRVPAAQDAAPEVRGVLCQRGSLTHKAAPSAGWLVSHSLGVNAVPTLGQTLFQAPELSNRQDRQGLSSQAVHVPTMEKKIEKKINK